MLDVIARLLLSAGILVGTTYLPMLSQAVTARPADARASAVTPPACPAKAAASGARALACLG
ncbi:hypothetical protein ACLBX9_12975 [Methylobacterium sp. A49B]|uniref:Uncharacterized protein n=1 Tax=Methylobacterium mesophilicum SR1.6/6 TaxID=908290 RepID=A0A6B9FPV9_9HYPH|nr:hypothetical protein [Methylobacterium mesophilicum]QGY03776.1 hypothetical protein MMSR116_19155 [Methylobacterium mesophilicum SR1.6/6]